MMEKIPKELSPEMLDNLQRNTIGGEILCSNYVGGYAMLDEIYEKIRKFIIEELKEK